MGSRFVQCIGLQRRFLQEAEDRDASSFCRPYSKWRVFNHYGKWSGRNAKSAKRDEVGLRMGFAIADLVAGYDDVKVTDFRFMQEFQDYIGGRSGY